MPADKTIEAYDLIAEEHALAFYDINFWMNEFKIFQKYCPKGKVLDLGCGSGRDAELLTKNGYDYMGIDASRGMLKMARKRVPTAHFHLMNFYELKFPPKTFDCFWAAASLLHVPKNRLGKVLESIKRITKENALGFISVKEKSTLDEGFLCDEKRPNLKRFFAFYTHEEFSAILRENGFDILENHLKIGKGGRYLCFFVKKRNPLLAE